MRSHCTYLVEMSPRLELQIITSREDYSEKMKELC